MSILIGITGGIGSGKSTIAKYIESKGYPVYYADEEAKKIMQSKEVITKIKNLFGDDILINEQIDRVKLAKIVFSNPDSLSKLNKIIHPIVAKNFNEWKSNHTNHHLIFKEAAILFESGSYKDCGKIITVTAPKSIRIKRVVERDKVDEIEVLKRINNQWEEKRKIELSDYNIVNIDLIKSYTKVDKILEELQYLQ